MPQHIRHIADEYEKSKQKELVSVDSFTHTHTHTKREYLNFLIRSRIAS